MATSRALAPLLVAFFLLATPAPAVRTVTDTVQELCSKTQFPKICTGRLTPLAEAQKASPRRVAELFVNLAAEAGSGMAAFVNAKLGSAPKDAGDAVFKCYDSCSDEVEEAVAHLNGLAREPTDGKFLELKSWLSSTLGGTSACEDACRDAPQGADRDAVVKYSVDIEKMLRITLDLIAEASGAMSAGIALPPTDASAPAYGAAAPFGGYGSGAAAPAPETLAVLQEGDGSAAASAPSDELPPEASQLTTDGPAPSVAASEDASESEDTADTPAAGDADATA